MKDPIPPPHSELPDELRQLTKSESETTHRESEEREVRETAAGRYEKRTTRSETIETKTSSNETFEPAVGAARLLPSSRAAVAPMAGLPPQVKMEVVGTNQPGLYDADFIMQEVQRSQERCRWQVEFPSQNGLHRASLEAQPNPDGTLALRAYLEGRVEGPHWSNRSVPDLSGPATLTFDAESGVTPSAGVNWPPTVSLTPLFEPIPQQGHFISPEPTAAEMAMMAMGSSSSGSGPKVTFVNNTRNGDRVVSAKDVALGLPGGIKKLDVTIKPDGTTATLTIKTKAGGSGTAVFQSTGTATRTVTGTKTVTIEGRNISNGPRDVFVEVKVGNDVLGTWDFTVFRVDVTTLLTGDISTKLPASAINYVGKSLRDVFKAGYPNRTKLGHQSLTDANGDLNALYAGVVFKGKIVPSGIASNDFNAAHSRSESFNWGRVGTFRTWDENNCVSLSTFSGVDPRKTAMDGTDDDPLDLDEDCTPAADGVAGELFIWSVDTPQTVYDPKAPDGTIERLRYNFTEAVSYAGVKAGADVKWYWRTSTKTNAAAPNYVQLVDVTGDNKVATGESTLTWNLMAASTPAFTLTDWTPLTKKKSSNGGFNIQFFKVTGTGLKPAGTCKPVVVISRTDPFNTHNVNSRYRSKAFIQNHTDTSFEGIIQAIKDTVTSPDDPTITYTTPMIGVYAIDVYIGDRHVRHTKTLTILPN